MLRHCTRPPGSISNVLPRCKQCVLRKNVRNLSSPVRVKSIRPQGLSLPSCPSPRRNDSKHGNRNQSCIVSATQAAVASSTAGLAPGSQILVALTTAYVVPLFAMMMFAPHWKHTKRVIRSYMIFTPMALIYLYLLVRSWQPDTLNLMMPGDLQQGLKDFSPQFFPRLDGISVLFSRLTTAASVWVHILTINLSFARITYLQGVALRIPIFHTILIAAVFGPLGILSMEITKVIFRIFSKDKDIVLKSGDGTITIEEPIELD